MVVNKHNAGILEVIYSMLGQTCNAFFDNRNRLIPLARNFCLRLGGCILLTNIVQHVFSFLLSVTTNRTTVLVKGNATQHHYTKGLCVINTGKRLFLSLWN